MSIRDTALWLHGLGANVTAINPQRADGDPKSPIHRWKHLRTERQTASEARTLPWGRASGVGIIAGAGGFRVFDLDHAEDDRALRALLRALRLPDDYPWVYRSGSGEGYGVAVRCLEELPPDALPAKKGEAAVYWGWPQDGAGFHHLELRWNQHCILPPSAYVFGKKDDPRFGSAGPGYRWLGATPTEAPALVSAGRIIDAFYTLCPPKAEPVDRPTIAAIRERFDLVAYARAHVGGDEQAEGDEVRFLNQGGLLINPDKGIFHCFADDLGGDALDFVAWRHYRTTARNLNGKFHGVLEEAADFAGVPLPAPTIPHVSTTPSTTGEVVDAPRPRFRLVSREEDDRRPPPSWVLEGEVLRGGYHLIFGATGSGKTFYALDRSLRVAAQGGRCVYIATEGIYAVIVRRQAWEHHHRQRPASWHRVDMPEGIDLADPAQVDELLAALAGQELDLITIDTLREAHSGDENSSQDGRAINAAVQRLIRETGAAVDVVHHSGVNEGRERGSTAIAANCDLKWKVVGDERDVMVTNEKNRLGALVTPRNYRITPTPEVVDGAVLLPAEATTLRGDAPLSAGQRAILDTLSLSIFSDSGAKTAQIETATGLKGGSLFRALSSLKNRGFISHEGKGDPYTITSAGCAALGGTTTSTTASGRPTTTSTSHLPASTTVDTHAPDHLPTTTTTRKGGSGGRWEEGGSRTEDEFFRSSDDHTFTPLSEPQELFPDEALTPAKRAAANISERKALADEYELLTGAIPPGAPTVEWLRAEVERLRAEAALTYSRGDDGNG
jgi:adenosyl cobinamide kinase/adenosyl cobinamide phosphate guanylyltransferase